jgi:type IV secretion system protein VirB8
MDHNSSAMPLLAPKLAEHFQEVASFQKLRARLIIFISRGMAGALAISLIANLGLAWTMACMLPLTKLVPVYLLIRQDGTIDTSVTLSSLPKTTNEAVIRAALWQYVLNREGYTFDTAQYRYDLVSGMSGEAERQIYQSWFNYPNPTSPQVTIGKKGTISLSLISIAFIGPHVAQVRYVRQESMGDDAPISTTWTATLAYQQLESLPVSKRLTNPGAVIITSYQNERDTTR